MSDDRTMLDHRFDHHDLPTYGGYDNDPFMACVGTGLLIGWMGLNLCTFIAQLL